MRTWAPKGQTPIIQFHFNWKHVAAIAGLTRSNFLFRLYDGAIKSAQIVLDSTQGAIQMAVLPPYSPDLNPVESL